MIQRLEIYQSLWAMERRHTDGHERRNGNDTTDRWAESLLMRDWIRELWDDVVQADEVLAVTTQ